MSPTPEVQREKSPRSRARVLDRLLRDAGLRRRTFLGATGAAVIIVVLATVLLTVIPLSSFKTTSDRLTWAGDVLVGATLVLAAIAAIVALVAYAVSTGLPDLHLRYAFGVPSTHNPVNNPRFRADIQEGPIIKTTAPEKAPGSVQLYGRISLRNDSGYSAKNPAVIVRFGGPLTFVPDVIGETSTTTTTTTDTLWATPLKGWTVIDFYGTKSIRAVQWDGGPNYSIHGHSTRRLPDLRLDDLHCIREGLGMPTIVVEILAEGYKKVVTLPVNFCFEDKWLYRHEKTLPEWI